MRQQLLSPCLTAGGRRLPAREKGGAATRLMWYKTHFFIEIVMAMELVCEKYGERQAAEEARCRHPQEYCKFRNSCMIHFLGREAGRQEAAVTGAGREGEENHER